MRDRHGLSVEHVNPRRDVCDDPLDGGLKPFARDRGHRSHLPVPCFDCLQLELGADLGRRERAGDVLLVGKHQQRRTKQPLLKEQFAQLVAAQAQPRNIRRIHNPNEALARLEVVAPVRPNRCLPAHVPNVELVVAVLQSLNVEPQCRRDRARVLALESLDNSRLAGVVKPKNQKPHLALLHFDLLDDGEQTHRERAAMNRE
eukprot:Amastigsp_a7071_17.p1 type:complete len:202 gc:universal Amastigsp_a7071_17:620-15(-)